MPGLASVLANLCPLPTSSRCFRQAVAEMLEEFEELKDKKMVTKKKRNISLSRIWWRCCCAVGQDSFARTHVELGFTHTNELTTQ